MNELYPNIMISAENREDSHRIKRELVRRGLFSKAYDNKNARDKLEETDILVLLANTFTSSAVALLSSVGKLERKIVTMIVSSENVCLAITKGMNIEYTNVLKDTRITSALLSILPGDILYSQRGCVVTDVTDGYYVLYRGVRLFLTPSESLVMHYLNRVCDGSALTSDIAENACISKASVPVLINGINTKSRAVTGKYAVASKHGYGYKIISEYNNK